MKNGKRNKPYTILQQKEFKALCSHFGFSLSQVAKLTNQSIQNLSKLGDNAKVALIIKLLLDKHGIASVSEVVEVVDKALRLTKENEVLRDKLKKIHDESEVA